MNSLYIVYIFTLFFVLTPGVILSLPTHKLTIYVAITHAVLFTLIWFLTHKMVWQKLHPKMEGVRSSCIDNITPCHTPPLFWNLQ